MEPEKFENNIKKLLGEREIKPSAQSWEQLEQRLQRRERRKRPYLLWGASAAAIAAIFFVLGTFFNAPIASEAPQMVEKPVEVPVIKEKLQEPEVIRLAAAKSSVEIKNSETEKKPSAERPVKNAILETPGSKTSEEEKQLALETTEIEKPENELLLAEHLSKNADPQVSSKVSDTEVEALLLLAAAELKQDPAYTVDSRDLLFQVEYELEQSFRQKVFEVVKEGFSKAKTAVANRDF